MQHMPVKIRLMALRELLLKLNSLILSVLNKKGVEIMNNFKVLMNGIIKENPTFVLLLGMCPTLGTTSSAINGMGSGIGYNVRAHLF